MTRVLRTRAELRDALAAMPRPVGLVPTMGWLHDGHRSLMRAGARRCATTVVTIFVNPRQFDDASDYTRYPRSTDARPRALRGRGRRPRLAAGPVERSTRPASTRRSSVGAVAGPLEGAARPGHFDGVATVVAILFALVGAEHAYFGQKDAQQVLVIERMAADLALPTRVVRCPTVREPDGLALSSRNVHLSPDERRAAPGALARPVRGSRGLGGRRARCRGAADASCASVLAEEPLARSSTSPAPTP